MSDFIASLNLAREILSEQGRLSQRGLGRALQLDSETLDEIIEELVEVQQVAKMEGKVLVWAREEPAVAAPSITPVEQDIASYTPKHLADKILASRSAMEGEKKQVTVLFCDVAGSMDLAEALGPEAWHETLNQFFEVLTSAIHEFEGTVNQYTGDGIMALFGAPIAAEDHARRAGMAALTIQKNLQALRDRVQQKYSLTFVTRIGLNSGEVVVGKIGDDLRMDYTAQGQVVGIAARLEALAGPDSILVAGHYAQLIEGYFELESLGPQDIKGINHPIEVFQLGLSQADTTRFDVSRQRGLTRFVGREADMATLQASLEQAIAGNGQIVGVVAEAGTGKSRLCYEFLETCKARNMTVLEGHALSHTKNIPFLPILQVFKAYYGISEDDDDRAAREKVAGRLVLLDDNFKDFLPIMFEFFGITDPAAPPLKIAPEAKQRRLLSLLRKIVQGADPSYGNIIVYIEDLHWLDEGSEVFLEEWVEALAGTNSLLLVNFRPEYRADWMRKSYYRQVPLAPLLSDEVQQMLVAMLGPEPSVNGLADIIFQRTGGNPFFCEEVVKSLQESGDLSGQAGHFVLTRASEALDIPASVHGVLAARIDRLSEDQKLILQTAAVIGRVFSKSLMTHVIELSDSALDAGLAGLKAGEFIFQRDQSGRLAFTFKHALTQEVALNSQLSDKLRKAHATVATAYEQLHADHLDQQAALIAHHWEAADQTMVAARWHGRAADAVAQSNHIQSIFHCMAIIRLTQGLANTDEDKQIRLRGLFGFTCQGGWRIKLPDDESDALVEETCAIARSLGDADMESMARGTYGFSCAVHRGDLRRALEIIEPLSDKMSDSDSAIWLMGVCGFSILLVTAGQLERVQELLVASVKKVHGDYAVGVDAFGLSVLLNIQSRIQQVTAYRGQLKSALEGLSRLVEVAMQEVKLPDDAAFVVLHAIDAAYLMGIDSSDARATAVLNQLDQCAVCHEGNGSDYGTVFFMLGRVYACMIRRDRAEAKRRAKTTLAYIRTQKTMLHREAEVLALLSFAQLDSGDLDSAIQSANQGLVIAQRQGARPLAIHCHLALVRALLAQPGAITAAEANIRQHLVDAMQLVDDTDARVFTPQIIEQRGRLAASLGDVDTARTELKAAHMNYVAVGADGHAARLAEELGF
jgi:class 3 adenylate cyclase